MLGGYVIGVDMMFLMVIKVRNNVRWVGILGVEFWLGEIEYFLVVDFIVDVILLNCVINFVFDKLVVF